MMCERSSGKVVDRPMGKEKTLSVGSVIQELFQLGIYKRSQGRIARQVTCAVVWVTAAIVAWRIWVTMGRGSNWRYLICR